MLFNLHRLRHGVTEAIEAIAHGDAKSSRVVGRRIEQIKLPEGAKIVTIVVLGCTVGSMLPLLLRKTGAALRGKDIVRVPLIEGTGELKTVSPEEYAEAEVFFG